MKNTGRWVWRAFKWLVLPAFGLWLSLLYWDWLGVEGRALVTIGGVVIWLTTYVLVRAADFARDAVRALQQTQRLQEKQLQELQDIAVELRTLNRARQNKGLLA